MKIPIHKILQELGLDDLELKTPEEIEEFKKELQFQIEESERDYTKKDSLGLTGEDYAKALNDAVKESQSKKA